MGLTSAESRLNNVISKVKTVTPEIENIQAGLQSTMQTSRAKLQKSLEFGFEKTQSGLANVRNSLDSGLEKTRSELDNVRSQVSKTILHLEKTRSKLSDRRLRLP